MQQSLNLDIIFREDRLIFKNPEEYKLFYAYLQKHKDKIGYIKIQVGSPSKSNRQLRFFHGILLESFSENMGDPDREYIKALLKSKFLTVEKEGKKYIRSLRDLTVQDMRQFLDSCVWLLVEFGGSLDSIETHEYERVKEE